MSQKIIPITYFSVSKFKKIVSMLECKNHKELVDYIKRYAYGHSKSNLYKTYILIDEVENPIAYISFSLSNIDNEKKLHKEADISLAITYPIPALKITRLLVDDRMQGQGYGTQLLNLADILAFVTAYQVGCKLILVDAKNNAKKFYINKNFIPLKINKDDTTLMLKKVSDNISNDLLELYIDFCKDYNLKPLEIYLNILKK